MREFRTKKNPHNPTNRSQSNRFPINQIINNFTCLVSITVETRTLNYWSVSKMRQSRKDKILELQGQGLDTTQN